MQKTVKTIRSREMRRQRTRNSRRLLDERNHASEQSVTIDELMLERREHVHDDEREQHVIEPDVHQAQRAFSAWSGPMMVGSGSMPRYTT